MHLSVKVIPRSARSGIAGTMADGTLRVRLAAPPEGGKANRELREVLARRYGVRAEQVVIISGAASTRKLVRIGG